MINTKTEKDYQIEIIGEDSLGIQCTLIEDVDDVQIYRLDMNPDQPLKPNPVAIKWNIPAHNVKGVWKPTTDFSKRIQADWELDNMESRISIDAPVISLFGNDDMNTHTFACSNAINKLELNARIREENDRFYCHIILFSEKHSSISNYSVHIRIDSKKQHFSQSLINVSKWWETFEKLQPAIVPDIAKQPLYSTWYQFHQNLDHEVLINECKIASQMGYEAIIIDDGWQTKDNNRGYDYTGDWLPERLTETKQFVEAIHQTGMKLGFWYSVPFCGKHSKAYQRFRGKFLTENHRWAPVFDPRFPEVRAYLINIYKTALIDWDLDGFKLDFIDDFKLYPDTELTAANGRDFVSINEAVDRLMTDIKDTLTAINPDIFIEFRQKYTGPAMRKYGNMLRAFDCPGDGTMNRVRISDIRMLAGNTAVHSDMITWHLEEKVEVAALQMVNTLFGVPQLSIELGKAPDDHMRMIEFYTKYWKENSEVLIGADFVPYKPLANYPILHSFDDNKSIFGLYDDNFITLTNSLNKIDVINGKLSTTLIFKIESDLGFYDYEVLDCCGNSKISDSIKLDKGLVELTVPSCGLVQLRKR